MFRWLRSSFCRSLFAILLSCVISRKHSLSSIARYCCLFRSDKGNCGYRSRNKISLCLCRHHLPLSVMLRSIQTAFRRSHISSQSVFATTTGSTQWLQQQHRCQSTTAQHPSWYAEVQQWTADIYAQSQRGPSVRTSQLESDQQHRLNATLNLEPIEYQSSLNDYLTKQLLLHPAAPFAYFVSHTPTK